MVPGLGHVDTLAYKLTPGAWVPKSLPLWTGPAWTPNGEELVLVRNAPSQGDPLIRVDVQTREELVIPTATVNNSEPSLAEDPGSGLWKLAFVSQGRVGASDNAWRAVWSYELPRERSR